MASKKSMQPENGSDSDRPNSPASFYKIISRSVIRDQKLRIPEIFVETYGSELSNVATLVVPNGCVCRVGLEKADKSVWFHDGWQKFMERHSIRWRYFLVFKYKGNSSFSVLIFDLTASEIQYTSSTRSSFEDPNQYKQCPVSDEEEIRDDDSVEILGSSLENLKSRRCYLTRSKRRRMEDQIGITKAENVGISCGGKSNKSEMSKIENRFMTKIVEELQAAVPSVRDNGLTCNGGKLKNCMKKVGVEDQHPVKGAANVQVAAHGSIDKGHRFNTSEHAKTAHEVGLRSSYKDNRITDSSKPIKKQCPLPGKEEMDDDDDAAEILGYSPENLKLKHCYLTRSKRRRMEDHRGITKAENVEILCEGKSNKHEMSNSNLPFLDVTTKEKLLLTKTVEELQAQVPSVRDNGLQFNESKLKNNLNKSSVDDQHPMKGTDDVEVTAQSGGRYKGHLFSPSENTKTAHEFGLLSSNKANRKTHSSVIGKR